MTERLEKIHSDLFVSKNLSFSGDRLMVMELRTGRKIKYLKASLQCSHHVSNWFLSKWSILTTDNYSSIVIHRKVYWGDNREKETCTTRRVNITWSFLAENQDDLGSLTAQCISQLRVFLHLHLKDEIVRWWDKSFRKTYQLDAEGEIITYGSSV